MAEAFYARLRAQQQHAVGCVLVASQAAGKTTWVKTQPDFVDADDLIGQYEPGNLQQMAAKVEDLVRLGAWVVTSTWWELRNFDGKVAVVSIPEEKLRHFARKKKFDADEAVRQASLLTAAAKKEGIGVFPTFEAARFHATLSLTTAYINNSRPKSQIP